MGTENVVVAVSYLKIIQFLNLLTISFFIDFSSLSNISLANTSYLDRQSPSKPAKTTKAGKFYWEKDKQRKSRKGSS